MAGKNKKIPTFIYMISINDKPFIPLDSLKETEKKQAIEKIADNFILNLGLVEVEK